MKAMQVQKEEVETLEASGGPKVRVEPYDLRSHFVQELLAREQSLRAAQAGRTQTKGAFFMAESGGQVFRSTTSPYRIRPASNC